MSETASLFEYDAQADQQKPRDVGDMLDRVLDFACDIDHALVLADALGWSVLQILGPRQSGGGHWVMLSGPVVTHLTKHQTREIITSPIYANAQHASLWGALVLALIRGVKEAALVPAELADFAPARKIAA